MSAAAAMLRERTAPQRLEAALDDFLLSSGYSGVRTVWASVRCTPEGRALASTLHVEEGPPMAERFVAIAKQLWLLASGRYIASPDPLEEL